jgi:multisubunit Na+/H+ antiporter MnhG subunit
MSANTPNMAPDSKQMVERIAAVSPEGRPAFPRLGARGMIAVLVIAIAVIALAGLAIGLLFSPWAGVVFAIVLVPIFVASPIFWATILRAQERRRVELESRRVHSRPR